MAFDFHGVATALVTPFTSTGVDWEALRSLVDAQIDAGIHGLVPCGTTGETSTLSVEEHDEVVRVVVEQTAGRAKIIAGAGSNSTAEAVARTRHAGEAGADAVLHVLPYYNRPGQNGIVAHFAAIAAEGVPIVAYNIPGRCGVGLTMDSYRKLAAIPEVVATKEATGTLDLSEQILREGLMTVLSGDDGLTFPLMCLGGHGVVSVASNIVPSQMVSLWDRYQAGDITGARDLHFSMLPLFDALFLESNPAPVKSALARAGRMEDILRLPLQSAGAGTRDAVGRALAELGVPAA